MARRSTSTTVGSPNTPQQRTVLAVAILATFIAFLDGSVVNVALPAIGRELGGGLAAQQWIVDAYLLTLGAVILLAGSLSDLYGRRRVLLWGLVGFAVASAVCALAPTAGVLIVARGAQGVAGALLVPSSLALILSAFRGAAQARAIGAWTAVTSLASIAGPVVGGVLVDTLSWRWVFGINLLPIAVTLLLLRGLPADPPRAAGARVDGVGAALAVVGLGLSVFALIEHGRYGWTSPVILGSLVVGLAAAVAFVLWERRAARPMLPLAIFRERDFSVGNVATAFIYGGVAVGTFALALFLQQGAGYSATLAGFAMVPSSVLLIALSAMFGRLSGRIGPRLLMTAGPLVAAGGFALMLRIGTHADYVTEVLPAVALFGLGMSITVAPLTATILGAVDSARSGIASAVNNAVSRVAGLVTVALAGSVAGTMSGGLSGVDGFHALAGAAAVSLAVGALVSAAGIRNPRAADPTTPEPAAHQHALTR
ncbi:DHA2 family efflux MFS transporter permease subunit [Leifsonia sp. F6_8S_P_1B]|uniref:DHA2 family efflux MFS transporter permease subunit n=1 Tax=Leifsonia williamsii TaxID=3035919 RepID=A0ABT8KFR7_9MICO|nr:DHA2 family efflux MFS transporter permease subunit [Leifsonia williamsii]MDN4616305.1 DHA2 family efflux MFS transporter permease subunit [Leifsonia williamsii]